MYTFVNAAIPELPRFSTLAEWKKYRPEVQKRILRSIGADDIIARHKLNFVGKGKIQRDGYSIEKIAYESFPGMWVSALVWTPDKLSGKAPAMVSISGHNYCDSKGTDHVQARSVNLVKRGFIVLSYDYFGCWERGPKEMCAPGGWRGWEHTNMVFSYTGRTHTAIEVMDGIRAVDYLYSRPDVDRERIGFTGESGGGNNTHWVSAVDDRISLSVPTATTSTFEHWIKHDLMYDWHQTPNGVRGYAEVGTLLALVAPRPLLIQNGSPDLQEVPLPEALRSYEYAKAIYRLYGAEDRIAFYESPTTHGYQPDKRAKLYEWIKRWYFDGEWSFPDQELPYTLEPLEVLQVGLPDNNLTIQGLTRRWVDETEHEIPLPRDRPEAQKFQEQKRRDLDLLLARKVSDQVPAIVRSQSDDYSTQAYRTQRFRFRVDGELLIPGVFVRGNENRRYETILVLGRKHASSPEASALASLGYALFFLDVRGTGEMSWGGGRTSNFADFVGRSPVGMWAEDVYKVVNYLVSRPDVGRIAVLGYDLMGKVALYASAMDPRIAAALVSTDSLSYRQDATSGLTHIFADVPRILTWGDTQHLAAMIAPRPLGILRAGVPTSLNGEAPGYIPPLPRFGPVESFTDANALAKHYDWTRRFYALTGASSNFSTGMSYTDLGPSVVGWFQRHYPARGR
jgi:cephalosporin-C deacetylase-like acetyl esterase